jgi:hypothetical protein
VVPSHFADLLIDPTASTTAYAVRSDFGSGGHVFKTTNGATWTNISGNLPDLPVWSIAIDPRPSTHVLYIGTDNGAYVSYDQGTTWSSFGAGLPNVQVHDLELNTTTSILAAGTYGRGLWEIMVGASSTTATETFDELVVGQKLPNWGTYSSEGNANAFAATSTHYGPSGNGYNVTGSASTAVARTWFPTIQAADQQVSAMLLLNQLIPGQVLARGNYLDTANPEYYALAMDRNGSVTLKRAKRDGTGTTQYTDLAPAVAGGYLSGTWVRLTLTVTGSQVQGEVYRPDNGTYLTSGGTWQATQAFAFNVTDSTPVSGSGYAGLGRPSSYSGTITFDTFQVTASNPPPPGASSPNGNSDDGENQDSGDDRARHVGDRGTAASGRDARVPISGAAGKQSPLVSLLPDPKRKAPFATDYGSVISSEVGPLFGSKMGQAAVPNDLTSNGLDGALLERVLGQDARLGDALQIGADSDSLAHLLTQKDADAWLKDQVFDDGILAILNGFLTV